MEIESSSNNIIYVLDQSVVGIRVKENAIYIHLVDSKEAELGRYDSHERAQEVFGNLGEWIKVGGRYSMPRE